MEVRSMKRESGEVCLLLGVEEDGLGGGVSSTPSLTRCLVMIVSYDSCYVGWGGDDLPIHGWDFVCELVVQNFGLLRLLDVGINALGLFKGRNSTAHPGGAAGELVVRGKDGPV